MSLSVGDNPMLLTKMKIDEYLAKCSRGEETVEDAQAIVTYLREVRGKARPDIPTAKAKPAGKTAATPGISVDKLLEGL